MELEQGINVIDVFKIPLVLEQGFNRVSQLIKGLALVDALDFGQVVNSQRNVLVDLGVGSVKNGAGFIGLGFLDALLDLSNSHQSLEISLRIAEISFPQRVQL